jgi:lysophospholipid acyltransferase (LPLAT)-like uncharacterized protein
MVSLRRIGRAPWVQKTVGVLAAEYLRLVWWTNRFTIEPADFYERSVPDIPFIVAMWHGQHFMMPFFKRERHQVKALISRHRDGAINAIAAARLGIEPVRGSGGHGGDPAAVYMRKGGASAFKELLAALDQGYNVALTADVPKVSRIAGRGVVQLARASGRPIYPVAVATSRRIELDNWDRSCVNLPFGHFAIAVGEPIGVPADADDTAVEAARQLVESKLNAVTDRAYAIVDRRATGAARG